MPTNVDSFDLQVRGFARAIRERLPKVQSEYARELRKAGFNAPSIAALARANPLAALQSMLERRSLATHWKDVAKAGQALAKSNVTPVEVATALAICDGLLDRAGAPEEFARTREQLKFSTSLWLNQAYYDVRQEEHAALNRMLEIEVDSSSTDVLLRRLLESVADACGAEAAHGYLIASDDAHWEIRASTARAASGKTLALVPAPTAVRKALASSRRLTNRAHILDAGWRERFQIIWSAPIGDAGVLQFAFPEGRELLPREVETLTIAGERCYAAIRKTRLVEEIARREEQLSQLAIRMLMVEENERRRISRELHDDAGQSLVVIRLQMELIEQVLPEQSEERERLAEARDITEKTILAIRRLISDLSPAVLEQLGLGAALRQLVNRFRNRYPCQVELSVGQIPDLQSNFQLVIYRLAQECLNNIAQHSEATTVNISVSTADRVLRLHVEDNGKGFDVERALEKADSFGLIGIRERVAVLGGSVDVISTRKEGQSKRRGKKSSTVVQIELPIP